ncbi:MAG: MFS transporter [Planctomycetes bacterium]|jgi:sugar phosphate permease|nr:MFS transporter [Planctomycetota bacterium]
MKKRYRILILLTLLSVITYLDRQCIAVAGPSMQEDLGLSPEQWGWVVGAFVLTYALFEIPSGAWGDSFGRKRVLARIVVWWSCFTGLTGLTNRFGTLVAVRALFGMGEAGAYPNISGCIARWFPATERARAQGVVWGASRIGGALAPLVVVPFIAWVGWREAFWLFASFGLVWAVAWYRWYHDDPATYPGISADELREIGAGAGPGHRSIPWKAIFRNRQVWLIMAMYWCYVWGSIFYLTWFPTYLVRGRGFSKEEMAIFASLPFALGALGNLAGGVLSDRLSRKYGVTVGRRLVGSVCLALSAVCLFLTAATTGKLTAAIFLTLGFGIMDCMLPSAWAMCLDIGKNYAGAISGAMNSAGNLGGFLCSVVFGYLVEATGQYHLPIVVVGIMVMLSALLFLRIDPGKQVERDIRGDSYGGRQVLAGEG